MGASKHDPRTYPPSESLRDREKLEAEVARLRAFAELQAKHIAELNEALGWSPGGSMKQIVEGVRAWRRALSMWPCLVCRGSGHVTTDMIVSEQHATCDACGGSGRSPLASETLARGPR